MITAHDPNATEHDPMLADAPRAKGFRRRDESLSREDVLQLVSKQTAATIPPWGVFASVGSGIALVISVMSYQSSTTQDKVDKGTAPLRAQIVEMDKRLSGRLDAVDRRLDRFGSRLDALEVRVGAVETRLERMDAKLDRLLGK